MRKLTVVGMGPGSQSCLTLEALEALRKADLIVGAGRLLETLPEGCSKNRKIAVSAQAVCDAVYGSDSSFPCVVCTGDTGCYSLCTGLGKYWDGELSILPGIGSMSYLAAKLQLPWQDWKVVSAHGRACDPVAAVTENPEVFFLTGPDNTAQELCRQLMQAGFGGCRAYVGEKLSYLEERIVSGTVREIAEKIFAPLAVLVVKREKTADDIGNDTVSAKKDSENSVMGSYWRERAKTHGPGLLDDWFVRHYPEFHRRIADHNLHKDIQYISERRNNRFRNAKPRKPPLAVSRKRCRNNHQNDCQNCIFPYCFSKCRIRMKNQVFLYKKIYRLRRCRCH